ncbi:hypothetical protein BSPCLSOX_2001 [uncultured Gammaproteobacteria bacterium]|jgi:hypothetical protein|nr:hypothetical protein BSPCLSOX_2001 [uncultured Gammaproteobacteria bacterium]
MGGPSYSAHIKENSKDIVGESTSQEEQDLSEPLDFKKEKQELEHKHSKHELAVGIYKKLFWSICVYIILVLLLLAFNEHCFQLRDWVLITLLSTTTANILGVFYIASKWLYETVK